MPRWFKGFGYSEKKIEETKQRLRKEYEDFSSG
jgi:hypothetical protein